MTIRTIPTKFKARGTVVLEIEEVVYFDNKKEIAFIVCWLENHDKPSYIPYDSLVHNEELERVIERVGKG